MKQKVTTMILYAATFKRKGVLAHSVPFMISFPNEDVDKVAQKFFERLQQDSHYTDLPERPIKQLYVSNLIGVRPDLTHITYEQRKAIAEKIVSLIRDYIPKEAISH
jgi:hypothetical protein